jgi:hypothetical protein
MLSVYDPIFLDVIINLHLDGDSNSMYEELGMEYKLSPMSRVMSGIAESFSYEHSAK